MIGRASVAHLWLLVIGLALASAAVALIDAPEPTPREGFASPTVDKSRRAAGGWANRGSHPLERKRQARRARRTRSRVDKEPGPRAGDLRRLDRERARSAPVARRFFSAFARYELGEFDHRITAQLRATATRRFAAELTGSPPRATELSSALQPAELGRLVFVVGELDARDELASAELVGAVKRGRESSPIAIEMVQTQRRWRVSGIGR